MATVRSKPVLLVALLLVVLVGGAAAIVAYDRAHDDRIAKGVSIGGIDVGGLTAKAARERVAYELADPLRKDVVARHGRHRYTLTQRRSRVAVDVDGSVEQALERSREGNVLTRTARGLTGGEVKAALEPDVTYDEAAVEALVTRARKGLAREPVDARVSFAGGRVQAVRSHAGVQVRSARLREDLVAALTDPAADTAVPIAVRRTEPRVTTARLAKADPTIIAVDRGAFTLTLYKRLRVVKTYRIAVGQVGLETPAGRYEIQNKAVDPVWNVPNSAWAGDKAGTVVPPGPANPLKARWMGIYAGAGIHGTDDVGSIGSAASHGCVRMAVPDVIDLYDRVDVGTPVYIA